MTLKGFTPYPPELVERYTAKGYWQGQTLGDLIDNAVKTYPHREAISSGNTRLTYLELGNSVDRLALRLLELGIKKEDRVVVQLPNRIEAVYFFFALAKIGAVAVIALRHFRHREISYLLQLTEAFALVIPDEFHGFDYIQMVKEIKPSSHTLKHVIVIGENVPDGMLSLKEIMSKKLKEEYPPRYLSDFRPDANDVALLLLTGGTTALPRLVPHTHNNYICHKRNIAPFRNFTKDSVDLMVASLGHNPGLAAVTICTMYGAKLALLDSSRIEDILLAIEREKATEIFLVPTQILDLLNFLGLDKYDLGSLQLIYTGGARCAPELIKELKSRLGCQILSSFGTSEGAHLTTRLEDSFEIVCNTVGHPCCPDDEFKIIDDEGNELPLGKEGELICRGPHCLRGYYHAPEENKLSFDKDGFFYTGDLAMLRADGNFVITGRKKDMILRGGENVSAIELEELIRTYPDVKDVAIVAMPDSRLGEKACAFIRPQPGKKPSLEEIVSFLKGKNIASFKLPERIELIDGFPLTNMGKISKKDLRENITKKLRAEGKISS